LTRCIARSSSRSRSLLGSYFIEITRKDMQKFFINLPERDLAYFSEGTEHFDDYVEAVEWAQDFPRWNHDLMREQIVGAVRASGELRPIVAELKPLNCRHFTQEGSLTRIKIETHSRGHLHGERVVATGSN
jgi:tRNA-splicing ligase RtcB